MEKTQKNLRDYSILILLFVGLSLVRVIVNAFLVTFAEIDAEVLGDLTEKAVRTGLIIVWVLSIVLLLPQVFVGLRGLQEAKNPTNKRGYIVWAKILFVLAIIATLGAIFDLFSAANLVDAILALVDVLIDVVIFFLFIRYAKQVSKVA